MKQFEDGSEADERPDAQQRLLSTPQWRGESEQTGAGHDRGQRGEGGRFAVVSKDA
jgi:hypothetical protein